MVVTYPLKLDLIMQVLIHNHQRLRTKHSLTHKQVVLQQCQKYQSQKLAKKPIPAGLEQVKIAQEQAFSDSMPKIRAEPVLAREQAPRQNNAAAEDAASDQGNADEETKKMNDALDGLNEDLTTKTGQIKDAESWSKELTSMIDVYTKKLETVRTNVATAKEDVKTMFKKKKQIENLKIQKNLEAKLGDANSELTELTDAILNVKDKETEFDKSKKSIADTIADLQGQITKLKGGEGEADQAASSSSSTTDTSAAPATSGEAAKFLEDRSGSNAHLRHKQRKHGQHNIASSNIEDGELIDVAKLEEQRQKLEHVRGLIRAEKEKIKKVQAEAKDRERRAERFKHRFERK
jgi:chromosome segregation ATPase